ncbi:MAG TPA: thioredoxin domain-containing protein [Solirubrobacterales bacterium]|nr:DsbA family protein [Solirubrobacterales bacterium]MCB8914210.1 thioredoxin domain-containing protein [Thermoleophilales bacterium]HNC15898.1 thioredoxin domain-containing protein [Solirubrobacterales bacterium]HNL62812.1 thioredoxin domain-containing protein [Solirubrobacterales bacterium]
MSDNVKLSIALVLVGALGLLVYLSLGNDTPEGSANPEVTRADSHYLTKAPDDKVTIVEFLDFECEACKAQFPTMERIREEYDGRINLAIRYFPLGGHQNGMNAALAVEAASKQGALEDMYIKMYETQAEWGESPNSKADLFAEYAQELGLDMDQFEADVKDPETRKRVEKDQADGVGLGVQGTPTIYLNGEELPTMPSYEDLKQRIDALLAE